MARPLSSRFRTPLNRPGPSFAEAIEHMRGGSILTLTYIGGAPVWDLDDGPVAPEVVALLLACQEIVATGDALFDGAMSQTWASR